MIDRFRYFWQQLAVSSAVLILGIIIIPRTGIRLELNLFIITLVSVTLINLAAWILMSRAIGKNNRDGVVVLLAGIGLKFLLYLLLILVLWVVTKKLSKPFILVFFALYLGFTLFLGAHLLKLLKHK
jgi:hypothetical protein